MSIRSEGDEMVLDREVNGGICIVIEFITFALAAFFSSLGWDVAAAILLMLSGVLIFFFLSRVTRNFLNSRGLFLFVWNGTIGLSCLKLHPYQGTWEIGTWLCLLLAALALLLGYDLGIAAKRRRTRFLMNRVNKTAVFIVLCGIIWVVFALEVVYAGTIPLLSSDMSSYVNFGLPYLHYITVTSATVPALAVVLFDRKGVPILTKIIVLLLTLLCALIPFALVSRQLILQMVIVLGISFFKVHGLRKIKPWYLLAAGAALFAVWMLATGSRNQSDAYLAYALNLESPKNAKLQQLYLYITYNYDIFNDNLKTAAFSTLGFRSLNPLWTLIGVKGMWPAKIVDFEHVKSIAVFTTAPMVFTPYCDFGVPGIAVFCFVVGFCIQRVEHGANFSSDRVYIVKKAILDYSLVMSFFTCFFSNTMIWVQLIVLSLVSLFCNTVDRKSDGKALSPRR